MPSCQYPACVMPIVKSGRFCERHLGTANLTLPSTPISVRVMETLEWEREEAAMATRDRRAPGFVMPRARATPPMNPVGAPRPVAPPGPVAGGGSAAARSADDRQLAGNEFFNFEKRRVCYPALLEARKTDRDLLRPLEDAFTAIKKEERFTHYHDAETAWFNCSSAAGRLLRGLAPAMMMRPIAEEVRNRLTALSLNCMAVNKVYAERYFFELSLYCDAVITKQDVSFIFGQASLVLGPVLAPVSAAVGSAASGAGAGLAAHAVGAGAAKVVTTAPQAGARMGVEKLAASTTTYATIPIDSYKSTRGGILGFVTNMTTSTDDPMRFTLAWLNFVTKERAPAGPIATIVKEFGGLSSCINLLEYLTCSNL